MEQRKEIVKQAIEENKPSPDDALPEEIEATEPEPTILSALIKPPKTMIPTPIENGSSSPRPFQEALTSREMYLQKMKGSQTQERGYQAPIWEEF